MPTNFIFEEDVMTHQEFWDMEFGHKEVAYDFAGREIHRDCHGDSWSSYGWDVDHIMPESNGGTDRLSNLQITNIKTNREKSNDTTFYANGRRFQVKHSKSYYDTEANYDYSSKDYVIVKL